MQLTDEDINEFRTLYEAEFGEPLSAEQGRAMAMRVIQLYLTLAEPLHEVESSALETSAPGPMVETHPFLQITSGPPRPSDCTGRPDRPQ